MQALHVPFTLFGGTVVVTKDYNEIVKAQVFDALTTDHGERLMNPTYGCNIRAMLFDPSDSLVRSDAANQIKQSLTQFVPRAIVDEVSVKVDPTAKNTVLIAVKFRSSPYVEATVTTVALDLSRPQV